MFENRRKAAVDDPPRSLLRVAGAPIGLPASRRACMLAAVVAGGAGTSVAKPAAGGEDGRIVRVIVTLAAVDGPLDDPARIAAMQDRLLADIAGFAPDAVVRFAQMPILALDIGPAGLRHLRQSPRVARIEADGLVVPMSR